jgi:hypothetical protein
VTRAKLLGLWLLCLVAMPLLLLVMFVEALAGSQRAEQMALAQDEEGNAMFGGPATQSISTRTGNALICGERWAHFVAPCIDFIFGKGHCLANATLPR